MKSTLLSLTTIILIHGTMAATAAPIFAPSRDAVAGTDSIHWGNALGGEGQVMNEGMPVSTFVVHSNHNVEVTVSAPPGSVFRRVDQGRSWEGGFAEDSQLLLVSNPGSPQDAIITLDFGAVGILAGGAYVQSGLFGPFTAQIELFDVDGHRLNEAFSGKSDPAISTVPFVGFYGSSPVPVHRVVFSVINAGGGNIAAFAIDQFDFTLAPPPRTTPDPPPSVDPPPLAHTPEPFSMLVWVMAAGAALFAGRASRTGTRWFPIPAVRSAD